MDRIMRYLFTLRLFSFHQHRHRFPYFLSHFAFSQPNTERVRFVETQRILTGGAMCKITALVRGLWVCLRAYILR